MSADTRPGPDEFHEFYAGYVSLVPAGNVLDILDAQPAELRRLLGSVRSDGETYRYDAGKWSVREVLGHVCDTERVFGYRALCIGRGDATALPGFDEKTYASASGAHARTLNDLASDFAAARAANGFVLRHLPESAWANVGDANGSPVSVRGLAYIMAGHVLHHMSVLRERYRIG